VLRDIQSYTISFLHGKEMPGFGKTCSPITFVINEYNEWLFMGMSYIYVSAQNYIGNCFIPEII
jgi:hypothetical protein